MAGDKRLSIPGATLFVYMVMIETLFTVVLFAVLIGSGRIGTMDAVQKALILLALFLVVDAVVVFAYLMFARTIVSLMYPVRLGEFEGLHKKALRLSGAGQFDEAVQLYREWIEMHPKDVEARFELARLLRGPMKRPEGAVAELTQALDVQPAKPWMVKTLEELADLYLRELNSPARAAAMFKVISEYYPGSIEAERAKKKSDALSGAS